MILVVKDGKIIGVGEGLDKSFIGEKTLVDDVKGKTVIPFTTHEGSGLARCVEDVKAAFPGANVTKGFSMYGHEVRTGKAKVEKWIKGLGF